MTSVSTLNPGDVIELHPAHDPVGAGSMELRKVRGPVLADVAPSCQSQASSSRVA
jgi:hypothetical protein